MPYFFGTFLADVNAGTICLPAHWSSLVWRMEAIFDTVGLWPDDTGWIDGRSIPLPATLAGVREVLIVGVMDHLELFDAARWEGSPPAEQ